MKRNVGLLLAVLILGIAIGAGGWLLGSSPAQAQADGAEVVAAVAIDWKTDYEPDPFEDNMLRSSKVQVTELALVRADGSVDRKRVR